jgi:hypothetical protein
MTKRAELIPTDAIPPLIVSDATHSLAGFASRRAFRTFVRANAIPYVKRGARVLVLAEDLVLALRRMRGRLSDGGVVQVRSAISAKGESERRSP